MDHSMGPDYITPPEFKMDFWILFGKDMQHYLIHAKSRDPMDTANPMDYEDIADELQHYWDLYLNKVVELAKKIKGDDNNNNDNDQQGRNKRQKKQYKDNQHKSSSGDNFTCSLEAHKGFDHP